MSFFDGEVCPDDNLKGILSIHLKLGKYIHSIKIWKSLDFGKNAYISKTVLDRAISMKFLTHRVSLQSSHANFQKNFVLPKMAAILNFRIFAQKLQNTKMLIFRKPC